MNRTAETMAMTLLLVAMYCSLALGQGLPPTILAIDLENRVNYIDDVPDLSKFATDPNVTTPTSTRNFRSIIHMGDTVAVNGRPVKGTNMAR